MTFPTHRRKRALPNVLIKEWRAPFWFHSCIYITLYRRGAVTRFQNIVMLPCLDIICTIPTQQISERALEGEDGGIPPLFLKNPLQIYCLMFSIQMMTKIICMSSNFESCVANMMSFWVKSYIRSGCHLNCGILTNEDVSPNMMYFWVKSYIRSGCHHNCGILTNEDVSQGFF